MFLVASYTSGLCVIASGRRLTASCSSESSLDSMGLVVLAAHSWAQAASSSGSPAGPPRVSSYDNFKHSRIAASHRSPKIVLQFIREVLAGRHGSLTSHVPAVPVVTVSCELMTACARSSLHLVLQWLAPNGLFRACRARALGQWEGAGGTCEGARQRGTRFGPSTAAVAAEQNIWKC